MNCKTIICAQNIIVDAQSKRLSAINILEDSIVNTFPIIVPLTVYTLLERADGDSPSCEAFLEIKLNGLQIAKNRMNVNFANGQYSKSIVNVGALPISSAGELAISVLCNDVIVVNKNIKFKPLQKSEDLSTATAI